MFRYYAPPADLHALRHARVAVVADGLVGVRDLLVHVGRGLRFPGYCGGNFDAFWDCVRDLDAGEREIVILHKDVPRIPEEDLRTYLELLRDAVLFWKNHPDEHSLAVWFPVSDRKKVEAVLETIPPVDPLVLE
ncbi:MAG: barstar family protein [Planctomycetota bacterium]|jgi:RNAse (barnase) inhibitor barstar|nr:barstar family protein [Planctomycetota bacterium]